MNIYDDKNFFEEYSKMGRSRQGLKGAGEWKQFKNLFPNLDGKIVLDLGCGYGWHCKYAVELGAASVVGIDGSAKMVEEAIARNNDPKISYCVCKLEDYDFRPESFDLVISNLVLHYIENLDLIFEKVYGTLKRDGVFLINIEHPIFTSGVNQEWILDDDGNRLYWPIDDYFYPGRRETKFLEQKVIKQHHTLTQIINGLLSAGFRLKGFDEAVPDAESMSRPGMKDELRRPMMLLLRADKSHD